MIEMIVKRNVSNKNVILLNLVISLLMNVTLNNVYTHVMLQEWIVAMKKWKEMEFVNMLVLHKIIIEIMEIVVGFLIHVN